MTSYEKSTILRLLRDFYILNVHVIKCILFGPFDTYIEILNVLKLFREVTNQYGIYTVDDNTSNVSRV